MANDKFPRNLSDPMDYMSMSSTRSFNDQYITGSWDDEVRRQHENQTDYIRYGLNALERLYSQRMEHNHGMLGTDASEAEHLKNAIITIEKAVRNAQRDRSDASAARSIQRRESSIKTDIITNSKTIVTVDLTEEIAAWAIDQMPNRYHIVQEGSMAHFLFEDMQSAALFKLQWG